MSKSLTKEEVLKEICKGEVVSGGLLASRLGISRTAVWKAVNALRAEGYFIKGGLDGYVLSPYNTRLCAEQLRLTAGAEKLIFCDLASSTNEVIKNAYFAGDGEFTVAVARRQSAGRGRLGRTFYSPEGGLYFSLLLKPEQSPEVCLKITTAAACAMARAIKAATNADAKIKWVNDIYVKGKKVCGILTEGAFDAENGGLKYAVLGVGVNVAAPKGGFPADAGDKAGALFDTSSPPSLAFCAILSEFLKNFKEYYRNIESMPHIEEYRKRSMLTGKTVEYQKGGKAYKARVVGIGDNAELIVKRKLGTERLLSGEVQITDYE